MVSGTKVANHRNGIKRQIVNLIDEAVAYAVCLLKFPQPRHHGTKVFTQRSKKKPFRHYLNRCVFRFDPKCCWNSYSLTCARYKNRCLLAFGGCTPSHGKLTSIQNVG